MEYYGLLKVHGEELVRILTRVFDKCMIITVIVDN